jgi:hypothetical protein
MKFLAPLGTKASILYTENMARQDSWNHRYSRERTALKQLTVQMLIISIVGSHRASWDCKNIGPNVLVVFHYRFYLTHAVTGVPAICRHGLWRFTVILISGTLNIYSNYRFLNNGHRTTWSKHCRQCIPPKHPTYKYKPL